MESNVNVMLDRIEAVRTQLVAEINVQLDNLADAIRSGEAFEAPLTLSIPLSANTSVLKGAKPISVSYGDRTIPVYTWKGAVDIIMGICNGQEKYHDALLGVRNTISGRDRMILSDSPAGMTKALKIDEGIYMEVHFDTESLFRALKNRIFTAIGFDCSGITINYQMLRSRR